LSKVSCTHCGLEFDKDVMIKDGDNYFCCNGCQGVYHLLQDNGLNSFYEKKGDTKLTPKDNQVYEDSAKFDLQGFMDKYVTIDNDGLANINLIIEGIHCSACVWLNEKVLHQSDGIVEASINFTTHKAKIIYDQDIISLAKIIDIIRAIGYNAYPYDPTQKETATNKQRKDYYIRLIFALFGAMNIMTIAFAKYSGYFTGMDIKIQTILERFEFVIATPVLFYSGWIYFKGAYYGLKNRFVNMDFLVSSGASLTYIYSVYAMLNPPAHTYFDSVVMIITFVSVGKFLEVISKKAIIDTLDTIGNDLPDDVMIIKDNQKIQTPSIEVKVDDIIEVKAGEKIVIDGVITTGEGSFDESSLTGESKPIFKTIGDDIVSGSMLVDSTIRYKALKTYQDSTIFKLTTLTQEAIDKKPKIQNLTNEVSGWFSFVILTIAFGTFLFWYYFGNNNLEDSLIVAISVIVIACPCALALATPIATLVGIGSATKNNLIYKEARFLETMSKAKFMIFDKTGTLTIGKPQVVSFDIRHEFDIYLVYTLVSHSLHPISMLLKTIL
jgi:Cu+-exporting ATPase